MSVFKNKIALIAFFIGLVALCQGVELPRGPPGPPGPPGHPPPPPPHGGPRPPMDDDEDYGDDDEDYDDEDDEESPEGDFEDLVEEHYETRMECQDLKNEIEKAKKNGTGPVDRELEEDYAKCQKYLTELRGKMQQMSSQLYALQV